MELEFKFRMFYVTGHGLSVKRKNKIDLIRPSKDKTISVAPQGSRLKEDDSTAW